MMDLTGLGMVLGAVDGTVPFSPAKVVFLILWFYLCLYSAQRSDESPLILNQYRALANTAALFVGPAVLFVLFVVDTVQKVQAGKMSWTDVPAYTMAGIFRANPVSKARPITTLGPSIELMDTAGRRFADVYAQHATGRRTNREILDLTERLILEALQGRASDILIDPKTDEIYTVRYRIDGMLRIHEQIEDKTCAAVINSIKAISGMDIAEKRRPQDGAFMARLPDGEVFFRVASSGVLGGEKLSIRVMDQTQGLMTLKEIGLDERSQKAIQNIIRQPSGMILVCGPTGSGKTTTLYAMLGQMNFQERNVVTIEDPIEHVIPHASQIEVNVKANVTFANSLRSILRQDPDVICVGEIRDAETAGMAVQAAQTGHLVLATLHASSNMAALVRMMDLGVRPLLLASALSVIISQRLIRRLCDACKGPAELTQSQLEYCLQNNLSQKQIFKANGCGKCGGTGYYGRTAITDVMYMDDKLRHLLVSNTLTPADMKQKGDKDFFATLRRDGINKVLEGITTLEEVKRVTSHLGG
jgi:type II secretory ATPase GspE/PulE/Tfp pilus assembly ATPase PilB-like protein